MLLKFFNPALICHLIFLVITSALLTACTTDNSPAQHIAQHITPYRITIVQGNFVAREAAAKLQIGMTRAQVKEILGTPLLIDLFHDSRWDYIFYFKRGASDVVQQRRFVVYFDGDHLIRFTDRDHLPSENELIAAIDGDKSNGNRREDKRRQREQKVTEQSNPS